MADFVDVRKVLREKNPRLYPFIPGFIFRWLRRVIHEEELNAFMRDHRERMGLDFARDVVKYFELEVTYEGVEHIPPSGPVIIASNHPLGGLDALALAGVVEIQRSDIRFIVNDILMNLENLRGILLGVNKHGKNSAERLREMDAAYASGQAIGVFPAGLVSRRTAGEIRDLEWKKSFITKSRQYNISVVPVHISGRNTDFFYRLANWRKRLGIKANLEMLYLVDEMFKQHKNKIHIRVGPALPSVTFHRGHSDPYWAALLRESIYLNNFSSFTKEV